MTLRKGLARLEGVSEAKLIIKPPHMQVRMKPGFWPDLPRMLRTIEQAGHGVIEDSVELRVTGKVVKGDGGLTLEVDGLKTPLSLALVAAESDPGTLAHLEAHVGERVELEGRWRAAKDGSGAGMLAVTSIPKAGERK